MPISYTAESTGALAAYAQVAIGLASVVIACVALRISSKVSQEQQRIATAATRPFVFAESKISQLITNGAPQVVIWEIKNHGPGPAINAKCSSRHSLEERDASVPIDSLELPANAAGIFMEMNAKVRLEGQGQSPCILTLEDVRRMKLGELRLYSILKIEYEDSVGNNYETRIKAFVAPASIGSNQLAMSIEKNSVVMC
jgi:hypothetical protein